MARVAVLFVDLLGVQRMWQDGGAKAVKARIDDFNDFVLRQLEFLPSTLHRDGEYTAILSGDSLSITCQDFDQAIGIGIHMFTQAFYASDKMESPLWLRGAISRWSNQYLTINTVPVSAKGLQVGTRYVMEDDYLQALALEKAGFKGMRLVVETGLLHNHGRDHKRDWMSSKRPLGIITRLKDCTYPAGGNYADVLWMADDASRYDTLRGIMAKRFKASTACQEEFVQAAWTRAVFDQVDTLVWTCKNHDSP